MPRTRFVRSGLAVCFALLLSAATPALAADGTRIAPQLAQLQAQDSLLEQLQSRTREAETRAAEAERREREAEINRLTDQAKQAQARADAEAQRNLAAQRELLIQQAKTELHNSATAKRPLRSVMMWLSVMARPPRRGCGNEWRWRSTIRRVCMRERVRRRTQSWRYRLCARQGVRWTLSRSLMIVTLIPSAMIRLSKSFWKRITSRVR